MTTCIAIINTQPYLMLYFPDICLLPLKGSLFPSYMKRVWHHFPSAFPITTNCSIPCIEFLFNLIQYVLYKKLLKYIPCTRLSLLTFNRLMFRGGCYITGAVTMPKWSRKKSIIDVRKNIFLFWALFMLLNVWPF